MDLRADSLFAGCPDLAAMVFDDLADNRKSDAASSFGGISLRIGAVKPVENVRQILGCDAFSVILDLHLDKISHILDPDVDDTPLFVQIFHRVTDDVVDHPLHLLRIGNHHHIFINTKPVPPISLALAFSTL